MTGIHRERPGFDEVAGASGAPAIDLGHGIWMSPGWSNSYLLCTDDGRVVVNAGMGFEGPLHRRAYDAVDSSPIRWLLLTQGHYDHVGGADVLRDEGTDVVMQANYAIWRDDNERLESFRSRNSAFAFIDAIVAAMDHARAAGVGATTQARPEPTIVVEDRLELVVGGRELHLIATPGGETTDSLVIWEPVSRSLFSGNLFGPLFGHVPNLVTIRGDRYRDAMEYVASLDVVHELRPDRLITGHFDPIEGSDRILATTAELQEAMRWVHDRTVDGMNAGADVHTLMSEIRIPDTFDVGEGYGQTKWNVRAIWENYSGWFHHRSTTELFGVPPLEFAADVLEIAGRDAIVDAARRRVERNEPVVALQLTDLVLDRHPADPAAVEVALAATRELLDRTDNFWEAAWLRRSIDKLEEG